MSHEFHIGAQVVCVDDKWVHTVQPGIIRPTLGCVYTIREIFDWSEVLPPSLDRGITFTFEEIVNPRMPPMGLENSFYHWHFKPVKKTSIDTFTSMLNKTPKKTKVVKIEKVKEPELV